MIYRISGIFIVCLLFSEEVIAQTYKSMFGKHSTWWNIILYGYCDAGKSEEIILTGDTIIFGVLYKNLNKGYGAVREDTVQGKAWYYHFLRKREYLIMDLSLQIHDPFYMHNTNSNDSARFEVDSVYYENSLKHVRITAKWEVCYGVRERRIVFIEGSGTNAGILYPSMSYEFTAINYMLCHYRDGIKVLGNEVFDDRCEVNLVKNNDNNQAEISVYPNPSSEFLIIDQIEPDKQSTLLRIFNINGKLLYSGFPKENKINITAYVNGKYFILYNNVLTSFIKI